jgi:hypothetical protein
LRAFQSGHGYKEKKKVLKILNKIFDNGNTKKQERER